MQQLAEDQAEADPVQVRASAYLVQALRHEQPADQQAVLQQAVLHALLACLPGKVSG